MKEKDDLKITKQKAQKIYPGASTDRADDDKVSKAAVKQATKLLDNNPRSKDM